jgi:hypothetical protein
MADQFAVIDMSKALLARSFPTITLWNRVEGRPRTVNFERALRAEVRDALWMISRQWQVGEFKGEDAGSPVSAKAHLDTTKLTHVRLGDAASQLFDPSVPLEAQVETQPLHFRIGTDRIALDLRLMMGRRWLKLTAGVGDYANAFIDQYRFTMPNPAATSDAAICAHAEVWQCFAAVAERAVDGGALYEYLTGASGRHAYDGMNVLNGHKPALDIAAKKFIRWMDQTILQPGSDGNPAWQPRRLEYRFSCEAPTREGTQVYAADEYCNGTLDWHNFDIDPAVPAVTPPPAASDPRTPLTRTMIPVPLTYAGMPHPRWWTFEDGRTNFGEIRSDTTDLAKLLFIEFGLVYSNDWFVVPFSVEGGSIAAVAGLAVTNVFGERLWIDAAGRGLDDDWQRWGMYGVNIRGEGALAADTSLLFLPVVPKVQESEPLEEIVLMRDEMANMVWAIEKAIPAGDGRGRSGGSAARETRAYFERLVAGGGGSSAVVAFDNDAKIRYDAMSAVPENWVPFVPVRAEGSNRAMLLQRAAMLRVIEGDPAAPLPVRPRTSLLRSGLDDPTPTSYLVPEEEVPRAGAHVTLSYQRTRWLDGRVFVWSGARKRTGRGEGSTGLAFDRLIPKSRES